jgi:hypothetical protein
LKVSLTETRKGKQVCQSENKKRASQWKARSKHIEQTTFHKNIQNQNAGKKTRFSTFYQHVSQGAPISLANHS